ncbi:MAG: hypothetical protein ABIP65_09035 [Vicinamibacterales bacterium]
MTGKNMVWLVGAVAVGMALGVSPASAEMACSVGSTQDVAVTRTGTIPGLGSVTGTIGWDKRMQLSLVTRDVEVTRTITTNGQIEITIVSAGDAPLLIRAGGPEGIEVSQGGRVVRGSSDPRALRAMLSGRAATAFREHVGEFERRLIALEPRARADDPHADGFLVAGAFVSSLAGDPTAMGRARDLVMRRLRGRVLAAGFQFRDCVSEYEKSLLQNDSHRSSCLDAANSRDAWYQRAAERTFCEVEFIASTLSAEGQFISCSALLPLVAG